MMGSAGMRFGASDIEQIVDEGVYAVDDDQQNDRRDDRARGGNADGAGAGLRLEAAPDRPASRIAVISGPSSRSIESPTRSATKISAPNCFIGTADWNARMMPSRKEISATIGSALTPTCSQVYQTSFQRMRCGCVIANHNAELVSPMKATCTRMSRPTISAARPISATVCSRSSCSLGGARIATGSNWSSRVLN